MKSQTSINSLLSQLNKLKAEVQELKQRVSHLESANKPLQPPSLEQPERSFISEFIANKFKCENKEQSDK